MIRLVEQALRGNLTGLNFVERYGAVAMPVTAKFERSSTGSAELPTFGERTFPVSCDLTETECFEQGKYKNLVPNDAYMSVAYLEQQGGATVQAEGPKFNELTATERVRFVCWLNMKRLGIDNCEGTTAFELAAIDALIGEHRAEVDGLNVAVLIRTVRVLPKSPAAVFGAYSYAGMRWAFFWPYDFFAVEFDAVTRVNRSCIADVTLGTPVNCVTTW